MTALCGACLAGFVSVAWTNVLLLRAAARAVPGAGGMRIAMMPRWKGDPYFAGCREGAEEAARELDVRLVWDGPNGPDATGQTQILNTWLDRRFDAIAVAPSEQYGPSVVLRRARARGIPVIAWDSDTEPDSRDLFVNPAGEEEIGRILANEAVNMAAGNGEVAVLAGACPGLFDAFRARLSQTRKAMKLTALEYADGDADRAFRLTHDLVRASPSVKVVVSLSPTAMSGAAEAILQSGPKRAKLIGVGLPGSGRRYLENGVTPLLLHWNPRDLGYLTVYAAALLARHKLDPGADSISAGRLGSRELCGGEIVLGHPSVERSSRP
jgi:rhamnose transport system permease protein